jgi:hypothetical protein
VEICCTAWRICSSFASLISATREGTLYFCPHFSSSLNMHPKYDRGKTGLGEIEPTHEASTYSTVKSPRFAGSAPPQYFHARPRIITLSSSTVIYDRALFTSSSIAPISSLRRLPRTAYLVASIRTSGADFCMPKRTLCSSHLILQFVLGVQ